MGPIFVTLSCHDSHHYYPLPWIIMGGSNIRHTIMPWFTPLKARNRGSIANSGSRKHLVFPNSGILTKFQCGVTKGPTRNYSKGGGGGVVHAWIMSYEVLVQLLFVLQYNTTVSPLNTYSGSNIRHTLMLHSRHASSHFQPIRARKSFQLSTTCMIRAIQ